MPALEASDVSMRRCGRSLVQRVSLTAERGELLALCGPEGSGTRTLLHLLSGHLLPDVGRVRVDGRERGPRRCPASPDPRALASGPESRPPSSPRRVRRRSCCSNAPPPGRARPTRTRSSPPPGAGPTRGPRWCSPSMRRTPVAAYATTVALFVAGRLLSWGAPTVALVPAVHILSARREVDAAQAGSIMTSST